MKVIQMQVLIEALVNDDESAESKAQELKDALKVVESEVVNSQINEIKWRESYD